MPSSIDRVTRWSDERTFGNDRDRPRDRPTARSIDRASDGDVRWGRPARARERHTATPRVGSIGSFVFASFAPHSSSSVRDVARRSIRSIRSRHSSIIHRVTPRSSDRAIDARETVTTTRAATLETTLVDDRSMDMNTARSNPPSDRAQSRTTSEDEDGDACARDERIADRDGCRRHSFSTDCSARTTLVAVREDDVDARAGVIGDDGVDVDTVCDGCAMKDASVTRLRALAAARGDVATPDGAELHADVCATLLRRERTCGRDAVMTRAGGDVGGTWYHAPYRGQLVEWILDVCAGERYGPTTADVAIAYAVRARLARRARDELECESVEKEGAIR